MCEALNHLASARKFMHVHRKDTIKRQNRISGSDDASVTILDVTPAISLVKTAYPVEILEPGDNVIFGIVITNESTASSNPVVIDSLVDSITTCSVP